MRKVSATGLIACARCGHPRSMHTVPNHVGCVGTRIVDAIDTATETAYLTQFCECTAFTLPKKGS